MSWIPHDPPSTCRSSRTEPHVLSSVTHRDVAARGLELLPEGTEARTSCSAIVLF